MASVLVVDDNAEDREMAVSLLNHNGIEAVPCPSGAAALEYLDNDGDIEIVLIDLAMGTLDGLTVAEEIRKNEELHPDKKPTHLAFFTGFDVDDPIKRVAERANVERIFTKATDVQVLPEKIKAWLSEIRQKQQQQEATA